jgi:hypothetical protein
MTTEEELARQLVEALSQSDKIVFGEPNVPTNFGGTIDGDTTVSFQADGGQWYTFVPQGNTVAREEIIYQRRQKGVKQPEEIVVAIIYLVKPESKVS